MHHHFNMKYEEAVAYPLVYPSIKGPFIHNGYPFSEILAKQIVYPVGEVPRHFGDSAAIISVRHGEDQSKAIVFFS
ncbi:hypothetical protein GCK32_015974 [Trichostrongylus colubriformis]|uniref:Uncharacterized protein n=1 Tax=Trichostrongylus colubriformis TaxID=6319 RepID=A0AAN8IHQ4_TRICO